MKVYDLSWSLESPKLVVGNDLNGSSDSLLFITSSTLGVYVWLAVHSELKTPVDACMDVENHIAGRSLVLLECNAIRAFASIWQLRHRSSIRRELGNLTPYLRFQCTSRPHQARLTPCQCNPTFYKCNIEPSVQLVQRCTRVFLHLASLMQNRHTASPSCEPNLHRCTSWP